MRPAERKGVRRVRIGNIVGFFIGMGLGGSVLIARMGRIPGTIFPFGRITARRLIVPVVVTISRRISVRVI